MANLVEAFKKAVGHSAAIEDVITANQAHRLSVTLGRSDPPLSEGDPVPPAWHQIFFPGLRPPDELGPDGMAVEVVGGPDDPLPRRMFAGNRMTFHGPLRVGDHARRVMTLRDVNVKQGRSGRLVFATYGLEISGADGLAIEDEWDLVFREAAKPGENNKLPPTEPAPDDYEWEQVITPDAVMLFRYSACTFNPHRIHYDFPYVTGVEGYPGLVVHGPLTSTLLFNLAMDNMPGGTMKTFRQRARAPLFGGNPIRLLGRPGEDGNSCELWAVTPDGGIAMEASATFG